MAFFKSRENPRTASEVTKKWLEVVLSQYESKTCPGSIVEVTSFKVNPGCSKGDNFSSDVMRIVTEAQVTHLHGTPSSTRHSFVAKFLAGSEGEQEALKVIGTPKMELLTLSQVLPAFNAFQKDRGDKYRINVPEHVYSVCGVGEYVLMMQDLREAGFQMEDKRRGLNLSQLKTAVLHMARFHAVSYAFSRTHEFLVKYPDFKEKPIISGSYVVIARIVIEGLQDALRGREEEFPGLLETLTANKNTLVGKMKDVVSVSGKEPVVCLCHGDFWTNNIMFKYDEGGAVKDFAMIDWGAAAWRSPVTDLQYLIYTSTLQDLRRDHLKEVQMLYYDTITSAAADLDVPLTHWSFDDFVAEWRRTAVMGMVYGIMVNLISLSKFGRKLHHGTLTTGFTSWLKTVFGRMMMSIFMGPWMLKYTYQHFKMEFKDLFDDLASINNHEMTTRIMDLLNEAHRCGVLDS
ncbi:hypothetical protein GWK47_025077 [Chionoecetes opilio]|uniref:CHK kinase-like domain-containing protein n=1 Tax=Chionoecetes opilio TaxID=41210 RepID=A0A8J4XLD1_CHIOP|nr:hypothetical protein GWK47_025077 [Chionoecetes opilio]